MHRSSLHREKSKGMMEGDGGSSNPIHVQTLETRVPRRCLDFPSRNAEDYDKNVGNICRINHALHILGVMTLSPHTLWGTWVVVFSDDEIHASVWTERKNCIFTFFLACFRTSSHDYPQWLAAPQSASKLIKKYLGVLYIVMKNSCVNTCPSAPNAHRS